MTKQNQISTQQKDEKSIARINKYISFIERYPLYSILLVLEEYTYLELYEECAFIRDALNEYKERYENKISKDMKIPTHISEYREKSHQDMLERLNIVVDEEVAKEKAELIKLNLPINGL